jgi:hypothetical protein
MNIGIILPDLGMSQLAYFAINQCNIGSASKDAFYLFFQNTELPSVAPLVSCMNVTELSGFNGVLVSTSVDTTLAAINSVNSTKKIFYIWDLEWLRKGHDNFLHNIKAFRHPDVKLVCRSRSHAQLVSNYCNRDDIAIIPNVNIGMMMKLI